MKNKKISKFIERVAPIQPFLLGGLLAIAIVQSYRHGGAYGFYYAIIMFLVGFLVNDYFAAKRIRRLQNMMDMMTEISEANMMFLKDLTDQLRKDGIDIKMVTDTVDLKDEADEKLKKAMKERKNDRPIN